MTDTHPRCLVRLSGITGIVGGILWTVDDALVIGARHVHLDTALATTTDQILTAIVRLSENNKVLSMKEAKRPVFANTADLYAEPQGNGINTWIAVLATGTF